MEPIIVTTPSELKRLIDQAIREALPGCLPSRSEPTDSGDMIKGIRGLAEFLNVSRSKAQKLKDSGLIPYTQYDKTVLFSATKVREAMQKNGNKKQ